MNTLSAKVKEQGSSIPGFNGKDYWKNYMEEVFQPDLIEKWVEFVEHDWIISNEKRIHVEVYDTGDSKAPTLVFAHGMAGYARLLLPFLIPLRERGYNIVAPDLQGYGYNDGNKGEFEWNNHVQNMVDAAIYARNRFSGKILLSGASMGGPIAYSAASRLEKVDALICWCLWDLNDREFIINETHTGKYSYHLIPLFKALSFLIGNVSINMNLLISYDTLCNSDRMQELLKNDPLAGNHITLRGALSLILQAKPSIPFHKFTIPTLIIQPGADLMTPAKYSRKMYEQLGSEKKKYVELEGAEHFPSAKEFYMIWAEEVDIFCRQL